MNVVDKDGETLEVYSPNDQVGGLLWSGRHALREIVAARQLILQLLLRDFRNQFKQKALGYLWVVLTPLLGVASFLFLYVAGVLKPGVGDTPYTVYVLVGSSIWACLPGALVAVAGGLQVQADLLMRTRAPKIALALSTLAGFVYTSLAGAATVVLVFWAHGMSPSPWILAYPLLVAPMVLLGLSVGLVLSILGTIARDLTPLVVHGLTFGMYVTPVIYARETIHNPVIRTVIAWNPLSHLVEFPRTLIIHGRAENTLVYAGICLLVLLVALVCLHVFHLLEDLVAERL